MQRLRICYAKRGTLRFASHRDFARAFERALRKAGVPMAFSAGFSPHPKVSYLGAAPTGSASEAEYLEIGLRTVVDPAVVGPALDAALPTGFAIVAVVQAATPDFANRVDGSRWQIVLPATDPELLRGAVEAFLAAESVLVERTTKNGRRSIDARAAVVALTVSPGGDRTVSTATLPGSEAPPDGCGILDLVVRQMTPAVRPDDVLVALRATSGLELPGPNISTRIAQGQLDACGALADPLEPDRAVASEA